MNYQDQEDQRLLKEYTNSGDQLWLARLFKKYEYLIYGVCLKYTQNPEWSQDLKSQIYERLVLKAKNLETYQFKNWLYTFTKNQCLDELRKKKRKVSALDKFRKFQMNTYSNMEFDAQERLIIEEDKKQITRLMESAEQQLSEKQRICLKLFFFERFSYDTISEKTGIPIAQVKSHLQNGKRKMRNYLYQNLRNSV